MRCENCSGMGEVWLDRIGNIVRKIEQAATVGVCPDCIGGISSCCEGAVGCAEDVTNTGYVR